MGRRDSSGVNRGGGLLAISVLIGCLAVIAISLAIWVLKVEGWSPLLFVLILTEVCLTGLICALLCETRRESATVRSTGAVEMAEQKRALEFEKAQRVQYALRAEISAALGDPRRSLRDFLQPVTEAIVRHLGAAFARLWTLNAATQMLELQASAGVYTHIDGSHARVPVGRFKIGLIAEENKPHLTNDVLHDERISNPEWAQKEGMIAFAGYPLRVEDRVTGVMALFSRKVLSPDTLEALASIADLVAQGLERKRVQEERDHLLQSLQWSETQLRLVTDALPVLIAYINDKQVYELVNRAYENWLGVSRRQIVGRTVQQVLGEAYAPVQPHLESALEGKEISVEMVMNYSGTQRNVRVIYIPHLGTLGRVAGLFVLVMDITQQKRTEQALREAQEKIAVHAAELELEVEQRTALLMETIGELEAFSYSVSHDLRAPLRAMQGFSHVLIEEYEAKLGTQGREYLQRIVQASERMDRLIQDVLAYSRISRGELTLTEIDLEKVVNQVIHDYPVLQREETKIEIAKPLRAVLGHDASLTQCISNLLVNAAKFVRPGTQPHIRIWTEPRNGKVRLWVEDNGIGIAPENQQKIFYMFQRVHSDDVYEGTGIGLAIVRKAVQRMGGTLGVESEEGQGSRFWIELRAA